MKNSGKIAGPGFRNRSPKKTKNQRVAFGSWNSVAGQQAMGWNEDYFAGGLAGTASGGLVAGFSGALKSGRGVSVPGTRVRTYRAMAQASSRLKTPRQGGITDPRPSIIDRANWPSVRDSCQRGFAKFGTSGIS